MQGTWRRAQVGVRSIVRKEVVEHLGSKRSPLLFALILLSGLATAYFGVQSVVQARIREAEQEIAFLDCYRVQPGPHYRPLHTSWTSSAP